MECKEQQNPAEMNERVQTSNVTRTKKVRKAWRFNRLLDELFKVKNMVSRTVTALSAFSSFDPLPLQT